MRLGLLCGGIALAGCGLSVVGVESTPDASVLPIEAPAGPDASIADSAPTNDGAVDAAPPDASKPACAPEGTKACCGGDRCPDGTDVCTAGQCMATLRVRVNIDGRTDLLLGKSGAFFRHYQYVRPGTAYLDDVTWSVKWPNDELGCQCDSSPTTLPAPLANRAQTIVLKDNTKDWDASPVTLDQPTAANGFVASVKFNDTGGGASDYDLTLTYATR